MTKVKERKNSYLELILAITLVFIFIAMALKMLVRFAVDAEQMAIMEVVQNLEKALTNLTAEHLVANDMAGLSRWDGKNPIKLLTIKPENYAGQYTNLENKPASGNWYFDSNLKKLIYGVKHKGYFKVQNGAKAQAEYQLKFIYADNNGNRQFDAKVDEAQGLRLVSLNPYEWVN